MPLQKTKRLIRRLLPAVLLPKTQTRASEDYAILDRETATRERGDGWRDLSVVERQDSAYRGLIEEMYAGRPREDFVAAAEAIRRTGLKNPTTLEVGCGSGYYKEILSHLLQGAIHYAGTDYSEPMIQAAHRRYSHSLFFVGDATALPCADHAFDIVLNSVSLMHILRYEAAIKESCRVARRWSIFHTVPVLRQRATTVLRKRAYGQPTVEVIFNENELLQLFHANALEVRFVLNSISYDLRAVLGESTSTKTYVCEVTIS